MNPGLDIPDLFIGFLIDLAVFYCRSDKEGILVVNIIIYNRIIIYNINNAVWFLTNFGKIKIK